MDLRLGDLKFGDLKNMDLAFSIESDTPSSAPRGRAADLIASRSPPGRGHGSSWPGLEEPKTRKRKPDKSHHANKPTNMNKRAYKRDLAGKTKLESV